MNNPPGVAVVDSIAKLIEKEFHLILTHSMFVFTQVFLHIVIHKFKDEVQFLFSWNVDYFMKTKLKVKYRTILG